MAAEKAGLKVVRESVAFKFERSTKNTHRYQEAAEEGEELIGTLYVKKSAVDKSEGGIVFTPSIIYLTISAQY